MSHKYVSNKAVMKNEGFLAKLGSTLMSRTNPDPLIETKTQSSITWRKTSEVKARIKTATGTIAIYDDMSPEEIAELEQQATMMAGGSAPELSGVAATAVQTAVLAAGIGQEEQETTTVVTYLVVDDYSPDDSEGLAVVAGQKVILVDKSSPHKRPRLEGDESNTQLLDNSAARHKMAVRPKRNHPHPRSRAQEGSEDRWVVRDADSGKEGLVPSRFLALHSQETSTSLKASLKRSVQQLALEETLVVKKNLMKEIREFKSRKLSSKLLGPSPEDEARGKRTATIRELIETEEEFVKDLEFVMENYFNLMDKQTTPRNIRDHKELIFNNFKFISDFHQNVLIEGVKYHAEVPTMIGRTFLRLERDFDKHAEYCSNEPLAQEFLENNIPVKEYFEEYSQRLGDDKRLQEHLKLPIQRLNDYQLLLRELVKFSSRLGDDTTDLQRAYELMQTIPQRATDAKFISSIEGFKGNLFKLGRLLRHDWFSVKEAGEKARDRYLFLFKARILITKVKRIAEDRSVFILKDIIRLPETSLTSLDKPKALEFFHIESLSHPNYPIFLEARTPEIRDSWLTGIQEYVVDTASVEDLLFDDELRVLSQDIDEEDAGVVSPVPEVQEFEDLPEDYEVSDQIHREFQVPIEREPSPPHKRQKPETQPLEGVQEAEAAKTGPEVSSQQKAAAEAASSPKAANQQAKGLTLEQVEAPEPSVVAEQGQAPTTTTASPPTTPKETQLAEQQDLAEGLLKADASPVSSEARLTEPNHCVVKSEKVYPMEIAEAESRRKGNNKYDHVKGGLKGLGAFHEGGFASRAADGSDAGQRKSEVRRGGTKRTQGTSGLKGGEKADKEIKQKAEKVEDLTSVLGEASLDNHDQTSLEKTVVLEVSEDTHTQEIEAPVDTSSTKKLREIQWDEEVDFWSQWEEPARTERLESEPSQSPCGAQGEEGPEGSTPGGVQDASVEMRDVQSAQEIITEESFAAGEKMEPHGPEVTIKMDTVTEEKATVLSVNVGEDVHHHTGGEEQQEAEIQFDFWADRETSPPIRRPILPYANEIMEDITGERSSEQQKEGEEAMERTPINIGSFSKREGYIKKRNEVINNKNKSKSPEPEDIRTPEAATAKSEPTCDSDNTRKKDKLSSKEKAVESCSKEGSLIKIDKRGNEKRASQLGTVSEAAASEPTTAARWPTTAARLATTAASEPTTAARWPTTAASGPTIEVREPTTAASGPKTASSELTTAASGPKTASSEPTTAASGPTTAASGPTTAASGPTTAASGHTTVASEHTAAASEPTATARWPTTEASEHATAARDLSASRASQDTRSNLGTQPLTPSSKALEVGTGSHKLASRALKGGTQSVVRSFEGRDNGLSTTNVANETPEKGRVPGEAADQAGPGIRSGAPGDEKQDKTKEKEAFDDGGFLAGREVSPPLRRMRMVKGLDAEEFDVSVGLANPASEGTANPASKGTANLASKGTADLAREETANSTAKKHTNEQNNSKISKKEEDKAGSGTKEVTKREKWRYFRSKRDKSPTLVPEPRHAVEAASRGRGQHATVLITGDRKENDKKDKENTPPKREGEKDVGNEEKNVQKREALSQKLKIKSECPSTKPGAIKYIDKRGSSNIKSEIQRPSFVISETVMEETDEIDFWAGREHSPPPETEGIFLQSTASLWHQVDHQPPDISNNMNKGSEHQVSKIQLEDQTTCHNRKDKDSRKPDKVAAEAGSMTAKDDNGKVSPNKQQSLRASCQTRSQGSQQTKPSEENRKTIFQGGWRAKRTEEETLAIKEEQKYPSKKSSQPSGVTEVDVSGYPLSVAEVDTSVTLPETTRKTEEKEATYDLSGLSEPSHELEDDGEDWITKFWASKESSPPPQETKLLVLVNEQELDAPLREGDAKGPESHIPSKEEDAERSLKAPDVPPRKGKPEGFAKDVDLTAKRSAKNIMPEGIVPKDGILGETNVASKSPTPESNVTSKNQTPESIVTSKNQTPESIVTSKNQTPESIVTSKNQTQSSNVASKNPTQASNVASKNPTSASIVASKNPMPASNVASKNPTPESNITSKNPTTESNIASKNPTPESNLASKNPVPESNFTSKNPTPESNVASKNQRPESNVASKNPMPESNIASKNPTLESNVASKNPMPESNIALKNPTLESNVASKNPMPESNIASKNPTLESNVATKNPTPESNVASKNPTLTSEYPNKPEMLNIDIDNNGMQKCEETKSSKEVDFGSFQAESSPVSSPKNIKHERSPSRPCRADTPQRHSVPTIVAPTENPCNPVQSTGKGFSEGNRRDSVSRPFLTYEALDLPVFQSGSFQGLQTFKSKGKDVTGSLPILARTADAEKVMQKYRRFRVQLPPNGEEDDVNLDLWFDSDVRQPSPVRVTCFLGQLVDSSLKRKVAFIGTRNSSRSRTKGRRSKSTPARSLRELYSETGDKLSHSGEGQAKAAKSTSDLGKEVEGYQRSSRGSKGSSCRVGDLARQMAQETHNDLPSADGKSESMSERQQRVIAKGVKKGSLALVNRDSTPRGKGVTDKGQELIPTPLPSKRPRRTRVMLF